MLDLPLEKSLELLRRMLLIRRFEEGLIKLSNSGHGFGHFHVYIGQEPTAAPTMALLRPTDCTFTTHRNHGHLLARGADPGRLLAEIFGKATGYNRGRGGTLHASARELGFPVTSAVVGSILPLAAGAALTIQRQGRRDVSVCLFGDGAVEEGAFFEAANMAALWQLPVVFLCENNGLEAPGSQAGEFPASVNAAPQLAGLVGPFGIPSSAVDGSDVGAVYEVLSHAIERARAGEGPSFIEARTIRWPGSWLLWPALVTGETDLAVTWDESRLPTEYPLWHAQHDGLLGFVRQLIKTGTLRPEHILGMDEEVKGEMERAVAFALESPYPDPQDAFTGVFSEGQGEGR